MTAKRTPKRTIKKEKTAWECKYFSVAEYTVQGRKGDRPYYAVNRRHFNTVHILALTEKDEVVLVRQFRPPVRKHVIELPAGLCDDINECPVDAARRELLEETGFQVEDMALVFSGTVSPGLTNEVYNLFVGTNAEMVSSGGGVGNEAIEVFLKPRRRLLEFLVDESLAGDSLVDSKIPTALMLAEMFLSPEQVR